jgi:hypothetical protein
MYILSPKKEIAPHTRGRRLVIARFGLNSKAVYVRFAVDKTASGQMLLRVLQFVPSVKRKTDPHASLIIRGRYIGPSTCSVKRMREMNGSTQVIY